MPSEFSFQIDMDLIVPDFMDASVPLQQIGETLVNDARKNIRSSTDFETGTPFKMLAKKTVKDKIRLHVSNPNLPLYRFGVLFRAIHAYKVSKNMVVVGVIPRGKPPRDFVGRIQQEEGVNQYTMPITRRFLGVSTKRLEWMVARMERWVAERIQKAAHEYINLKV